MFTPAAKRPESRPALVSHPIEVEALRPRTPAPLVQAPVFFDRPEDKSLPAAIAHTLELRRRSASGGRVGREDLNSWTRTEAGNEARLLLDRAYFEEGLMPAIDAAKDSIHLTAYMFDDELIGSDLADRLIHKKKENPDIQIRVIADGKDLIFSRFNGRGASLRRLRDARIEVYVHPTLRTHSIEHRKMAIIDGRKALISGTNCSTEYYASDRYAKLYKEAVTKGGEAVERFLRAKHGPAYAEYWERVKADPSLLEREPYPPTHHVEPEMARPWAHDYGIELTGPAVGQLQASFVQSWIQKTGSFAPELSDAAVVERYFPSTSVSDPTVGRAKVTHAIPFGVSEVRAAMLDFIASATETLDIEVAYVFADDFVDALVEAAKRGVHIRLLTNGKDATDFVGTWYGFRKLCERMVDQKNIEIFETRSFTHVKLMVADRRLVLAATGNPERISWRRTFDELVSIESPELAEDVSTRLFDRDVQPDVSVELDREAFASRGWLQRALEELWTLLGKLLLPIGSARSNAGERPVGQHCLAPLGSE